jgi:hypothetical protein
VYGRGRERRGLRYHSRPNLNRSTKHAKITLGVGLGSVIKKRRKKMRKHKHKKMLKKTRWQRRAHA